MSGKDSSGDRLSSAVHPQFRCQRLGARHPRVLCSVADLGHSFIDPGAFYRRAPLPRLGNGWCMPARLGAIRAPLRHARLRPQSSVADRDRPLLVALRTVEQATRGSPLMIAVEGARAAAAPE